MTVPFVFLLLVLGWISPGMREHEEEFRQAWISVYGQAGLSMQGKVPPQTYKTWYKQFKRTGIRPVDWLRANEQASQQGNSRGSIV